MLSYPGVSAEDLEIVRAAQAGADQTIAETSSEQLSPASADPYAISGWKKEDKQFDVVTPSGQRCRARKLGFEAAIANGILNDVDLFTNALMEGTDQSGAKATSTMLEVLSHPERRAQFFGTINRCVAACVVKPKLVMHDDGNLPDDVVFVDDIPFPDKMFIFQTCFRGRTASLEPFREGQEVGVGDLATDQGISSETT